MIPTSTLPPEEEGVPKRAKERGPRGGLPFELIDAAEAEVSYYHIVIRRLHHDYTMTILPLYSEGSAGGAPVLAHRCRIAVITTVLLYYYTTTILRI